MKARLITTLLATHCVVALKSGQVSDDVSTNSDRYTSLQRTRTSLDSLMARSDERNYPRRSIEGQPGPHERGESDRLAERADSFILNLNSP